MFESQYLHTTYCSVRWICLILCKDFYLPWGEGFSKCEVKSIVFLPNSFPLYVHHVFTILISYYEYVHFFHICTPTASIISPASNYSGFTHIFLIFFLWHAYWSCILSEVNFVRHLYYSCRQKTCSLEIDITDIFSHTYVVVISMLKCLVIRIHLIGNTIKFFFIPICTSYCDNYIAWMIVSQVTISFILEDTFCWC